MTISLGSELRQILRLSPAEYSKRQTTLFWARKFGHGRKAMKDLEKLVTRLFSVTRSGEDRGNGRKGREAAKRKSSVVRSLARHTFKLACSRITKDRRSPFLARRVTPFAGTGLEGYAMDVRAALLWVFHLAAEGKADRAKSARSALLLDGIACAAHTYDTKEKELAYRDHLVHPLIVSAFGLCWLAVRAKGGKLLTCAAEEMRKRTRAVLGRNYSSYDQSLNEADLEWDEFAELVWLLASLAHDDGRHLVTLMSVQAVNDTHAPSDPLSKLSILPTFLSYPAGACFSAPSGLRRCGAYPTKAHIRAFVMFLKGLGKSYVGWQDLHEDVANRIRAIAGVSWGLLARLPGVSKKNTRLRGASGTKPDGCDHAIFSSLELFTLSEHIRTSYRGKDFPSAARVLAAALRWASLPVLFHHAGIVKSVASRWLKYLTWQHNPLGVLLRACDFFHNATRPFLKDIPRSKAGRIWVGSGYRTARTYLFSDPAKHIKATVSKGDAPHIVLDMPHDLDDALEHLRFKKPGDKKKMIKKHENEAQALTAWVGRDPVEAKKRGFPFSVDFRARPSPKAAARRRA